MLSIKQLKEKLIKNDFEKVKELYSKEYFIKKRTKDNYNWKHESIQLKRLNNEIFVLNYFNECVSLENTKLIIKDIFFKVNNNKCIPLNARLTNSHTFFEGRPVKI